MSVIVRIVVFLKKQFPSCPSRDHLLLFTLLFHYQNKVIYLTWFTFVPYMMFVGVIGHSGE
jgi:hypothetical protein